MALEVSEDNELSWVFLRSLRRLGVSFVDALCLFG